MVAYFDSAELAAEEEEGSARREMLSDLLHEADRLEGWVRDLLMSARGEVTATGAVDVNALLQESARSFAATAELMGRYFPGDYRVIGPGAELAERPARAGRYPGEVGFVGIFASPCPKMPAGV